jgi:hypothetical protein
MKKTFALFLSGAGLILATAGPAFAQADNLHLNFQIAAPIINNHNRPAELLSGSVGSPYLALATNNDSRGTTATTLNTSLAVLAGVLTLMLLQRRNHDDILLKPKH